MTFHETLKNIPEGAAIAVITHPAPDPDAIGSAMAVKWLFQKYNKSVDIIYSGEISHPLNKSMMNVFTLPLIKKETVDNYNYYILVDCSEANTGFEYFTDNNADIVIDHHKTQVSEQDHDYVYVKNCGACCSLLYEMIKEEFTFDESIDEDITLINCLLLGIKTDTNDLLTENLKNIDFNAYQELLPLCSLQKINAVVNYPLPKYLYELENDAVKEENCRIVGSTYISGIGILTEAKKDALPILADKLLRMEGIDTSVIFCVIGNELRVSVRSQQMTRDLNDFCQKLWGNKGGGKFGAGGASVPLEYFRLRGRTEEIKNKIYTVVKEIVFFDVGKEVSGDN